MDDWYRLLTAHAAPAELMTAELTTATHLVLAVRSVEVRRRAGRWLDLLCWLVDRLQRPRVTVQLVLAIRWEGPPGTQLCRSRIVVLEGEEPLSCVEQVPLGARNAQAIRLAIVERMADAAERIN